MIALLLKLKHRLPFLWRGVEWVNSILFVMLHSRRIMTNARACLQRYRLDGFAFRLMTTEDAPAVSAFLTRQPDTRMAYFRPHGFDVNSVRRKAMDPAFVIFGVFRDETLVGYFFLRCFWTRKAFVGRAIDREWDRQGIGRVMNQILYNTAWNSGFRCLTTISRHNHAVVRSHANNPASRILGDLPNDYMLVEMTPPDRGAAGRPVRDNVGAE
jgi:hypothetical protein